MRTIILLLLVIFFCDVTYSQEIVIGDKQWEGDQFDYPFGAIVPFNAKFRTTYYVVDGINYRELMYKVEGGWFEGIKHYYREEDSKVYKLYEGEERVILDFTLDVGDTIQVSNDTGEQFYFIPNRTVDTTIQNKVRRKLDMKAYPVNGTNNEFEKHVWIEGVGDIGFFFGNGIVYNNQKASVVYCVKQSTYIYGAGMFCPHFDMVTDIKESELEPDYYYDINSNYIYITNQKIKRLDIYSIGGIKIDSHPINDNNNEIDLSKINLPLCFVVIFDGKNYSSKILKL